MLRLGDEVEDLLRLRRGGGRLRGSERFVGVDVELDLRLLHVDRQIDEHGSGSGRAHELESGLEDSGHLAGFEDRLGHLRHRFRDRGDVDGLEVLFVEHGDRRLTGDAQDRLGVSRGSIEAGDHIGAGRT